MGCLRTIGCLTILAALAAAGYVTRDLWWEQLRTHHWSSPGRTAGSEPPTSDSSAWEPLTATGAARTKARIAALGARGGPAFVSVPGGDFASYIILDQGARLPHATDSAAAAVIGDALHLKTVVDLRSLGDRKMLLGPMAGLLDSMHSAEPLELAGTLEMTGPGTVEFRVTSLSIRGLPLPSPVIPRLLLALERTHHQAGAADDGVLIPLPPVVGDVRANRGRITLYRATP
jgi:hypothetical protein